MMDRRDFMAMAAGTLVACGMRVHGEGAAAATLRIPAEARGPQMAEDFIGLSYEVQQLADPEFFSARNTGLIGQMRGLAARGVLRLGGNTSEFAYWKPVEGGPEPAHPQTRVVEGEPAPHYYAVRPEAVRNLAEFLDATGWSCIYGINLGTNTPERAAEEAAFAARALGGRLEYFQVGNEADLYDHHLRDPKTWSAKAYLEEWLAMTRAISARVPGARFGMPDIATKMEWLTELAELWAAVKDAPRVTTVTHHYYFGGPATNPEVNIGRLLGAAAMERVAQMAETANAAAARMGARVRMTEGNTCYRGGKPGVSDVFAAALWSADYALQLASRGYTGVNLHGGTGKSVANSVGGALPGDAILSAQGKTAAEIATHPHPFYTPIGTFGGEYKLEPVGYGLKFAGAWSGARLFETDWAEALATSGVNATAYAAEMKDGKRSVVVLNKDAGRDLAVQVQFGGAEGQRVRVERLAAQGLESRAAHLTREAQGAEVRNGSVEANVPRASGLRLTLA